MFVSCKRGRRVPKAIQHVLSVGMTGWLGLLIAIGAGGGGALLLLVTSWRPASVQRVEEGGERVPPSN
jgi:hypothetical protein